MIDVATRPQAPPVGIVLPSAGPRARRAPDRAALDDALEAGRSLGFVPRDPRDDQGAPGAGAGRRKPGPRRREPRGRLTASGPLRIMNAFRAFCTRLGLTHWEGLDRLMQADGLLATLDRESRGPASPPLSLSGMAKGQTTLDAPGPATSPDDSSARSVGSDAGPGAGAAPIMAIIPMPRLMKAWIDARASSARYLDAGDYVRALIRRDQEHAETRLALETALGASVSLGLGAGLGASGHAGAGLGMGMSVDAGPCTALRAATAAAAGAYQGSIADLDASPGTGGNVEAGSDAEIGPDDPSDPSTFLRDHHDGT